MSTDETLLLRLKAGDAAAYEWLIGQFEGPLFRFFVCQHRDYHLAQEQTSETFVQVTRSISRMKGEIESLRAFVFAVARHVKLRHWRQPRLDNNSLADDVDVLDPHPTPAMQADQKEQMDLVLRSISQFEPTVRDVLLFRFVEGLSLGEVASLVELPLGTVKSHIHRGVVRLKKLLSDSGCHHD